MNRTGCIRAALCVALLFSAASLCIACPTCKDGIAEGPQHAAMVRGYFWSILFMMSMPFIIFGTLAAYFYYQVRQARAAQTVKHIGGQTAELRAAVESDG